MGNVTFDNHLSLNRKYFVFGCYLNTPVLQTTFQWVFFIETISQRKNLKPFLEQIIKTFKTGFIKKNEKIGS